MMVGVASGTYSSIFIASPVLAHWKEREPAYRNRRARIIEAMGHVPTFPEENVVAKIDEAERHALPRLRGGAAAGRRSAAESEPAAPQPAAPVALAEPEAVPEAAEPEPEPARRSKRPTATASERGRRARAPQAQAPATQAKAREESLMAALVWFTVGVALWHFTVFVPDRFWGGIVGAFLGAAAGAMISGADRPDRLGRGDRRDRHRHPARRGPGTAVGRSRSSTRLGVRQGGGRPP